MSDQTKPVGEALRKDIQGLRAIAVILVVIFHLWPSSLRGGFVGVDAFFVISGFLITGHLWREVEASGDIRLGEFWARRARRLLPASFTVLLVSALLTYWVAPVSLWERHLKDYLGAAFYSLNWVLAADAVDYAASDDPESPVQHYWSLSVEEQFYFVWPLLLLLALWLARSNLRRALHWSRGLLAGLFVASLVLSIVESRVHSSGDYFVTQNRVWEFGAGALLALFPSRVGSGASSPWLGVGGILVLIGSAFVLHGNLPFPGYWAAFPVLGTVLSIRHGQGGTGYSLERALAGRPLQWLGDHSYGVYLWHWPLIVFLSDSHSMWSDHVLVRALVFPLSCGLAALSKTFLEDPIRYGTRLSRRPLVVFVGVAGFMAVFSSWVLLLQGHARELTTKRHDLVTKMRQGPIPCFGPYRTSGCRNPDLEGQVFPRPEGARVDHASFCMANNGADDKLRACRRGAQKNIRFETALVGDSHAAQWSPLFEYGAEGRGERIIHMLKGSCPFTVSERESNRDLRQSCERFKVKVRKELRKRRSIRRVVLSASSHNQLVPRGGLGRFESAVAGYEQMLRSLPKHIEDVIVIRDVPFPRRDAVQCLERLSPAARLAKGACALPRQQALLPDPLAVAASKVGGRVRILDFTEALCDAAVCSPVVGHVLAYRDRQHLSETFPVSLAPHHAQGLELPRRRHRKATR